jgi:hypothetical protein
MSLSIRLWSGVLFAVLTVSSAAGQTAAPKPPPHPALKPGPSAGVHAAQQGIHSGLALVGASAVIALVVVATANNGGNANNQPNNQSVPATVP